MPRNRSGEAFVRLRLPLFAAIACLALWAPRVPGSAPTDASAMRIGLDPVTGTPIGMPAGSAAKSLALPLLRSDEGLVPELRPDGSVRVHLDGRFRSASVARINADGVVETLCTEDLGEAQAFLDGAATAPKVEVQ